MNGRGTESPFLFVFSRRGFADLPAGNRGGDARADPRRSKLAEHSSAEPRRNGASLQRRETGFRGSTEWSGQAEHHERGAKWTEGGRFRGALRRTKGGADEDSDRRRDGKGPARGFGRQQFSMRARASERVHFQPVHERRAVVHRIRRKER